MTGIGQAKHKEPFNRLKDLLREMFQLDRGDLDFGIYRIMNLKAKEIEAFLDDELLPQVKTIMAGIADEERAKLERSLAKAQESARKLGVDPDKAPKVIELQEQLTKAKSDANAETDVYNHLANFFARYYDEGDFMSLRRYSGGERPAYIIPYDGEEVKLHWANADQYYIKTTENYAAYIFTIGEGVDMRRVRFEIVAADNEKNNVKEAKGKQRRFVLTRNKNAVTEDGDNLVIRFEHRPLTETEKKKWPGNGAKQQDRINGELSARVLDMLELSWRSALAALAPTETKPERTLLQKHIESYTAKNSFDYFIHKDLGGFLRRELDLYLKTNVLNLNDLAMGDEEQLSRALVHMRAVRHVGEKIIAFLAQLEDFQRHLWLKKKFVLETQWCVTLDRVPESLYPEIVTNETQREEWVELFAINEISGDLSNGNTGYNEPLNTDFLNANPYLVLDTRHFSADFKNRLLTGLSNAGPLDKQTDGLLVHSENFQALNLLQARYQTQVKCVYIDPPYNTDTSAILYKNNYRHSSWMTLIANRIDLAKSLLLRNGSQVIAIDDTELVVLSQMLDTLYNDCDRNIVVVNHHPAGAGLEGTNISKTHEYAIFMTPSEKKVLFGEPKAGPDSEISFLRTGTAESNLRVGRPNSFYCVLVNPKTHQVVGLEKPPKANEYPTHETKEGFVRVYPVSKDGTERVWRRSYESCLREINDGNIICRNGRSLYIKTSNDGKYKPIFSNWTDGKYNAGVYGTNVLRDIIGKNLFSYPKSIHTVANCINHITRTSNESITLDYFAGSGTTGHAVIELNREDGGQRKYILVEMGDHFDTVMLPRIKKVAYSPNWKNGKPDSREKSVSQIIKYVRLESYEDTLDGLVLSTISTDDLLAESNPELAEDYRLRYALGAEVAGSPCLLGRDFTDPFAYTLSVVRDGARHQVPVDLPETFNYLLGLHVESRRYINDVLVIAGVDAQGQTCLILWRNLETMDNDTLEKWFADNRPRFPDPLNIVYVNGDHTLNAARQSNETWTAKNIESLFRELMFGELDNE